jgi:hypothetical protein
VDDRDAARAYAEALAEALTEMCDALDTTGGVFHYDEARRVLAAHKEATR